jgi:hypothetical protein
MKTLTEDDIKWKGTDYYYGLKRYFNKPPINDWYEKIYRQPKSIGYVSELLKKWKPSSPELAYSMYLESGVVDADLPEEKRGRTADEIESLAIEWKEKSKGKRPVSEFYDALVLHAVVETFFGNYMEDIAAAEYEKRGYETRRTEGWEDRTLGIDFIAYKDNKTILVQVKPVSFFQGAKSDLVRDRIAAFQKENMAKEKYGTSIFAYMIYNREGKWLNNNGRMNFLYCEMVGPDGSIIADINKMNESAVSISK